jgi:hypothetical protein
MIRPKDPTPITRQRPIKRVKQTSPQEREEEEEEEEEEEGCFEFRPEAIHDTDVSMEEIDEFLDQYPV